MPDISIETLAGARGLAFGVFLALATPAAADIPPFVAGAGSQPERASAFAGRVLITELGCTACHEAEATLAPKRGPDLSQVGARVRPDHLRSFIASPSTAKPGTTMPDMLDHLPSTERDEVAQALAGYLLSIASAPSAPEPIPPAAVDSGRALYHSIGCVACHSPEDELTGSVPLGPIAEKYSLASLTRFLKDPLTVRPGGRMPDLHLDHHEATVMASYLLRDQKNSPQTFPIRAGLVERGRRLFAELRCGACHATAADQQPAREAAPLRSLQADRPGEGCLSGRDGDWASYPLSTEQRTSIKAALKTLGERLDNENEIALELARFNCAACHRRNDYGGVAESRERYFTTKDPNLGEQGRIPPTLTGVGAKLKPAWLRRLLVQGAPSRPYCGTRMPAFGAAPMARLLELLPSTDQLPSVAPVTFDNENEIKRAGRELAGTDGLACVNCHTFREQKTGAMGALDMTLLAQRVTRDWFHHYLAEPQRFNPSTVMPAFWSGGESPKPEILNGDRDRQIEALWRFLSDGYSTDTPKGVRREPMRLLASPDEAVMLRRSYPVVGKRGIGVGYPRGVNLVFNAEQLCLSMIWRGGFADPAGVWTSQGHGTVRPLSRDRIEFTNTPELAVLEHLDSPWPVFKGRPIDCHFEGYRLDAERRPAFRYRIGDMQVEDYFQDVEIGDHVVLRRTLTLHSTHSRRDLVFRAAADMALKSVDEHRFRVGTAFEITVRGTADPQLFERDGTTELRVPVSLTAGRAKLVLEYRWQPSIR